LELVKARIARAERDRADLDRIIATAREEQRLLQRLLDVRRGVNRPQPSSTKHRTESEEVPAIPVSGPGSKHAAVQTVIDELATASRPLHISELMRLLHDRSVPIPGAGTQANLITHLRRDRRLVRTSRGMYGLSAWGLESMQPVRRVRRRRRRVRATAAK
jgi:hypothetical protein